MMNTPTTTPKFEVRVRPAGATSIFDGKATLYRDRPTVDATVDYGDLEVHILERADTCTYYHNPNSRPSMDSVRRSRNPRVYAWTDSKFDVVEDLTNRRRRPYQAWKPFVEEALHRLGIRFDRLAWNQKAGCSCGCSPGFVLVGSTVPYNVDMWVTIKSEAPTVDESKQGRVFA